MVTDGGREEGNRAKEDTRRKDVIKNAQLTLYLREMRFRFEAPFLRSLAAVDRVPLGVFDRVPLGVFCFGLWLQQKSRVSIFQEA